MRRDLSGKDLKPVSLGFPVLGVLELKDGEKGSVFSPALVNPSFCCFPAIQKRGKGISARSI